MFKMDESLRILSKILSHKTIFHIYSFPYFSLETFLATTMCVIYALIHLEISYIARKTLKLKPNTLVIQNRTFKDVYSTDSNITSVDKINNDFDEGKAPSTHITYRKPDRIFANKSSQLGWVLEPCGGDANMTKYSLPSQRDRSVISLSPKEYVRREKEKKKHQNELKYCLKSLTTLYDNVVGKKLSAEAIEAHIQNAKEQLQMAKLSNETAQYLGMDSEAITKSLFDLLEGIVMASSLNNPLPFSGNIATLAYDVGNLKLKNSPVYEPNFKYEDSEDSSHLINEIQPDLVTTDESSG